MQYSENFGLKEPEYGEKAKVDDLNFNTEKIDTIMGNNRGMIAEYFDQTKPYTAGKVVQLNGKTYRFKVDHAPGNFNPSEVDEEPIGNFIGEGGGGADVTKTASGNPITFDDGASAPLVKCVTQITGSQDLHGYDKPWVGGAGKNKWNEDYTGINANTIKYTSLYVGDGTFTMSTNLPPKGSADNLFFLTGQASSGASTTDNGVDSTKSRTITSTNGYVTVAYRLLNDDQSYNPANYKTMVELGSTATAYEPYSNICPITAYTENTIWVGGRNLYPIKIGEDYFSPNVGGSTSNDNGTLVVTTTSTSYSGVYTATNSIFYNMTEGLVGKFTYSFYAKSSVNLRAILGITNYGRGEFNLTTTWQRISMTATFPGTKLPFLIYRLGTAGNIYIKDFMVERGDTLHDYEEYIAPTAHATTYPSAIYRGSEDVVKGEVENLSEVYSFTGNETIEQARGNPFVFDIVAPAPFNINIGEDIARPWSHFVGMNYKAAANMLDGEARQFTRSRVTTYFSFCNHNLASVSDCATWLAQQAANGTPVQLVPKKTPTTESITPTNLPIKSLFGYNHIESTTGDMEIEYITEEFQPIVDLIEESGGDSHTYSTTEQVVGKWIDGSDVYEKTYDIGYLTSNNKTIAHGISGFGHIIQVHGYVTNGTYDFHLPHVTTDAASCVGVHVDSTNIYITSYDRSDYHGYVIIQYTKSTPTRSLNLTKSAIPDEIANAEYEEKPDVNEADDDAPTEEQER